MNPAIADLRQDYKLHALLEADANPDPIVQFQTWFNEGERFEGHFKKGLPHGKGTLTKKDRLVYSGIFDNGMLNGVGMIQWEDGHKYEGSLKDNNFEGTGKFCFPDGCSYLGEFRDNLKNGKGKFVW